jgi:isopentenyldiphosphate isomerase
MKNTELVDILLPPNFEKSGRTITRKEAITSREWTGVFNLWIVQSKPVPAVLYHLKSSPKKWESGKVGVVAGGHYHAGEDVTGGLREVEEEIGKRYQMQDLTSIGRRLYVGMEKDGKGVRQNVVDIFVVKDNTPIENFMLDPEEVEAICALPISELVKMYSEDEYSFETQGITHTGNKLSMRISKDSFPYNWDNYHKRMVYISERFLKGEKNLHYWG